MEIASRSIWWNHISGPRQFLDKFISALTQKNSVILTNSSEIAWPSTLYDLFQQRLGAEGFKMHRINASSCISEPGEFLVTELEPESLTEYLKAKDKIRYIKELFPETIIWLWDISKEESWIKFAAELRVTYRDMGLVFETRDKYPKARGCEHLEYASFISKYDLELFAAILLSEKGASPECKHYAADISASLCGNDAEILDAYVEHTEFPMFDPLKTMRKTSERLSNISLKELHPFAFLRQGNLPELEQLVWKSQLHSVFPIVELERIRIVKKWYSSIEDTLNNYTVLQFDERVVKPYNVELGTLSYLISKQTNIGKPMLDLPDENDRNWIIFLRDLRNELAHAKMSNYLDIEKLFLMSTCNGNIHK